MRLHTASGSVYELDESQKRIRRVSGKEPPTPRQGPDGEWREYDIVVAVDRFGVMRDPCVGCVLIIAWPDGVLPAAEYGSATTMTSDIVRVES